MHWKPELANEKPVYLQISHYIEEQIRRGDMPPGMRLKAERQLALQLSVNRSTISAAYEELRASGLVSSVQGSGTRVTDSLWETAPLKTPNWQRYTAIRDRFDPTVALHKKMYASFSIPHLINLAKGELSQSLMPLDQLQQQLTAVSLAEPFSYYCDFRGSKELRQALSTRLYLDLGIRTDSEHILVTAGVKHALQLIAQSLLQPGDAIAVEGPSYLYAMNVLSSSGLRLVRLPVDKNGLNPDSLPELAHKYRIRMVVTNPTYQNPTGTTLTLERRLKLLEICGKLRIPIIEDDPYSLLHLDKTKQLLPPLKALSGGEQSVIYMGTMSKTVTPGMRIGWIVAPLPVVTKLAEAKNRMGYSTSNVSERLAERYLTSGAYEAQIALICQRLRSRREIMMQAIKDDLEPYAKPVLSNECIGGGYYIWLKLKKAVPDMCVLEAGIQQGVLTTPGQVYGAGDGYMRLSYASIEEEQIPEGISRLAQALKRVL